MEELTISLRGDVSPSVHWRLRQCVGGLAAQHGLEVSFTPDAAEFQALHHPHGFTKRDFRDIESAGGFTPKTGSRVWNALIRASFTWRHATKPYHAQFLEDLRAVNEPEAFIYMPRSILQTLVDNFRGPHDKIRVAGIDKQGIDFLSAALNTYQPTPAEPSGDAPETIAH